MSLVTSAATVIKRSAGFQTCCIADFSIGGAPKHQRPLSIVRLADLEIHDTADWEVGATGAVSRCTCLVTSTATMIERSAGFRTCRIADFLIGGAPKNQRPLSVARLADLEIHDTADWEVGATWALSRLTRLVTSAATGIWNRLIMVYSQVLRLHTVG